MKDTILERAFMIFMLTLTLAAVSYAMGAIVSLSGHQLVLQAIQLNSGAQ